MALARAQDHSRFRELTDFFGSEYGPGALDVPSQMKALREELQRHGTDMDAPCTHNDEQGCWLLRELAPWNEILLEAGAGLYEEDFQRLTLKLLADELDLPLFAKEDKVAAAACLLYMVFKEHLCIHKFVMRGHDVVPAPSYWLAVIEMSLKASNGLQSLDLTFECKSDNTKRYFFDGVAKVKTLKEFYFQSKHCDSDLVARSVCKIVKTNCEHLQSVRITFGVTFQPQHIDDLFGSLGKCTALTSLELKDLRDAEAAFAEFMIENETITVLTVSDCDWPGLACTSRVVRANSTLLKLKLCSYFFEDADIIARALQTNTTLRYLHLTNLFISAEGASALASMLKVNETLREIIIDSNLFSVIPISHGRAADLADAISSNRTLTTMELLGFVFEVETAVLLIRALELNSTLSKLRVFVSPTSGDCDLRPVMEAINTTRTRDRLEVLWYKKWTHRTAPMLLQASTFFSEIHINYRCEPAVVLDKLFENLRGNRFVTSLSIKGLISDDAWCQVGSFLASNNTIHTLAFDSFPGSYSAMKKFSDGLARNSGVRYMKPSGLKRITSDDDPFKLAIGRNRSITSVDIGSRSLVHAPDYLYLSRSIVRVKTHYRRTRVSKRFQRTLQRNLSLVNGAVRFVLNPTMDRVAVGLFHEFQHSPEMFRRLLEATGESGTETTRRILCAANFVEDHFFVIVGVVKKRLVCRRRPVGGKVLQDLNDVCLRKIASYLRVSDVVS